MDTLHSKVSSSFGKLAECWKRLVLNVVKAVLAEIVFAGKKIVLAAKESFL